MKLSIRKFRNIPILTQRSPAHSCEYRVISKHKSCKIIPQIRLEKVFPPPFTPTTQSFIMSIFIMVDLASTLTHTQHSRTDANLTE